MYCNLFNPEEYAVYKQLADNLRRKKFSAAFGVQSAEKLFISANISGFTLYVTGDYIDAQKFARELSVFSKKPFEFLIYPKRYKTVARRVLDIRWI